MKGSFQMVQIMVTSADISALLVYLNTIGITVYHVRRVDDLTAYFSIRQCQYHQAVYVITHTGGKIEKCIPASGALLLKRLLRRPVLVLGGVLLLILTVYLPTRILFVTVSGNEQIPERRILDAASSNGLYFGVARHEIRSETIKNRLLSVLPELKWVGVNTKGCVAQISVCERTLTDSIENEPMVSNIIASYDGVISAMTVISGSPVCRVGQAVTKGELLVSGYSDCGRCVYMTQANAEIYAKTMHTLWVSVLTDGVKKAAPKETERKYGLLIGKKRINFFKGSGISDTTCVRMYKEYPITLPGGFQLPIALTMQEETDYDIVPLEAELQKSEAVLRRTARTYLESQMIAGKVGQEECLVTESVGALHLLGRYTCNEMIGQTKSEEIVKDYEQTD